MIVSMVNLGCTAVGQVQTHLKLLWENGIKSPGEFIYSPYPRLFSMTTHLKCKGVKCTKTAFLS